MKKNGFTLIELLAVIVILAIIALIAVPIVMNIIFDAKVESNKRSIELYAEAVKDTIARHQIINPTQTVSGNFTSSEGGRTLTFKDITLEVEYDGNVTCEIIEIYEEGNIYITECKVNNEDVEYEYGKRAPKSYYQNGEVVYYDVAKGIGCTKKEYENSWDGTDYSNSYFEYNGINKLQTCIVSNDPESCVDTYPMQNSCLKFYAFNDKEENKTLNLLLDHNIYNTTWNGYYYFKDTTSEWKGTIEPENYTYIGFYGDETIDYSGFNARLITPSEILQIIEGTGYEFMYVDDDFYFHDLSYDSSTGSGEVCVSEGCKYGWLYDRTSLDCEQYGCLNNSDAETYGYWIALKEGAGGNFVFGHFVSSEGSISSVEAFYDLGLRPVIEVNKSSL